MKRHDRHDPACLYYRTPRTWWGRYLDNRARGRGCRPCMVMRAHVKAVVLP